MTDPTTAHHASTATPRNSSASNLERVISQMEDVPAPQDLEKKIAQNRRVARSPKADTEKLEGPEIASVRRAGEA